MKTSQKQFRRIVTGHDADGKAILLTDAAIETYMIGGENGAKFHEIWSTEQTPIITPEPQAAQNGLVLAPPKGGTRIRVIDFPPEGDAIRNMTKEEAFEHFKSMAGGYAFDPDAPHPLMHRTETIDYGIVLEGELMLILDRGETVAKAGDIIIQRGTNHAWANRTDENCRVAFILVDAQFEENLKH